MTFRVTVFVLLGAAFSTTLAAADNPPGLNPPAAVSSPPPPAEFTPMTRSERLRNYLVGIANRESLVLAVASARVAQAKNTLKAWGGSAEGLGERVGNAYAQHVIH